MQPSGGTDDLQIKSNLSLQPVDVRILKIRDEANEATVCPYIPLRLFMSLYIKLASFTGTTNGVAEFYFLPLEMLILHPKSPTKSELKLYSYKYKQILALREFYKLQKWLYFAHFKDFDKVVNNGTL